MHTHAHVELQSGAERSATAKPEKKKMDASGIARSDIWCLATLAVVRVRRFSCWLLFEGGTTPLLPVGHQAPGIVWEQVLRM
jgi:hypothetical protein